MPCVRPSVPSPHGRDRTLACMRSTMRLVSSTASKVSRLIPRTTAGRSIVDETFLVRLLDFYARIVFATRKNADFYATAPNVPYASVCGFRPEIDSYQQVAGSNPAGWLYT